MRITNENVKELGRKLQAAKENPRVSPRDILELLEGIQLMLIESLGYEDAADKLEDPEKIPVPTTERP